MYILVILIMTSLLRHMTSRVGRPNIAVLAGYGLITQAKRFFMTLSATVSKLVEADCPVIAQSPTLIRTPIWAQALNPIHIKLHSVMKSRKRTLSLDPLEASCRVPAQTSGKQVRTLRGPFVAIGPARTQTLTLDAATGSDSLRSTTALRKATGEQTLPELEAVELATADARAESSSSDDEEEMESSSIVRRLTKRRRGGRWGTWIARMLAGVAASQTFLEMVSVSDATAANYRLQVRELENFIMQRGTAFDTQPEVDDGLFQYLNFLYFKGEPPRKGEKLLAGFVYKNPHYGKKGSLSLPRSWKAPRGWKEIVPSRCRDPEMLEVWCGMMWWMATALKQPSIYTCAER